MEEMEKGPDSVLDNTIKPKKLFGTRHIQFLMLCLSISIGYGMRTNLSVGIIAMTEENPPDPSIPTYPQWNNTNTVLSSFFWGYIIPLVGAGQLGERFGPKWFLTATMTIGSIFSILIPVMAANLGEAGVMICRVVQGFTQGFIYPSVHNLLSKWSPLNERSLIASFVYGGGPVGIVISMPLTGFIAGTKQGWPLAFYLYGGIGLCWSLIWVFVGTNHPSEHKGISDDERRYIQGSTKGLATQEKKLRTPWKAIATSLPMWAVLVAHSGQEWGHWTLLTEIPNYMKNILNFRIEENSLLSALPYFVFWILGFLMGPLADQLISRKIMRVVTVRKLFESIGAFVPSAALFWLAYIDSSQRNLAVTLLVIAVGSNAAPYVGYLVNCLDLSPNHAGTLFGISTCIANVFSILAPLAVEFLGDEKDPLMWRTVFIIAAIIYSSTNLFYILFASGDIQKWNEEIVVEQIDEENNKTQKTKTGKSLKYGSVL